VTYLPVRPDELLDRWEKSFNHSIKYLREALPSLADEKVEPVVNMRGEESIVKHALDMVANAKRSIFLELWKVDAERFCRPLQEAKQRGVDVYVVGYDDCTLDGIDVYQHSDVELMNGRWLILSVDDLEGMVSTVEGEDRPHQAVVTRNPGIVLIIKELIVHDIFLIDVERRLRPEIEKIYGENMLMRRQKVLGSGVEVGMH
jgi:sugar-specific transcriptional regulator TrmB